MREPTAVRAHFRGSVRSLWGSSVGRTTVRVYRQPTVAIIATGDEIVEPGEVPQEFQIRNSNAWSLAVQVTELAMAKPELRPAEAVRRNRHPRPT